ncbi:unnamed protein product [Sphagnum balticum]
MRGKRLAPEEEGRVAEAMTMIRVWYVNLGKREEYFRVMEKNTIEKEFQSGEKILGVGPGTEAIVEGLEGLYEFGYCDLEAYSTEEAKLVGRVALISEMGEVATGLKLLLVPPLSCPFTNGGLVVLVEFEGEIEGADHGLDGLFVEVGVDEVVATEEYYCPPDDFLKFEGALMLGPASSEESYELAHSFLCE